MRILWKRVPIAILLSAVLGAGYFFYEHPLDELQTKVCSHVHTRVREVAITFDDGPHPIMTPLLLDVLRRNHVKATFFVVGEKAEEYPQLLRRIASGGHQIACHTYSHDNLTKMSEHEVRNEIVYWERATSKIVGPVPKYMRPPGGDCDRDTLAVLNQLGYVLSLWCVNPGDWKGTPPDKIVKFVVSGVHSGDIILMHDERPNTIRALPVVIKKLRQQGYRFVTMEELAKQS